MITEREALVDGSPKMQAIRVIIENIADTDAMVLIRGESGVGKDLVARTIHAQSTRSNGPFVKVNCAAIPQGLLESELFGHEKGAFTGAHRRKPGQFELAKGGTIYLDEIAELPLALQAKLLHVLQDFRFTRVGGNGLIEVDARVIAATNRDLEVAMPRGEFREDLYYRLNVVELRIPPLRERREEIPGPDLDVPRPVQRAVRTAEAARARDDRAPHRARMVRERSGAGERHPAHGGAHRGRASLRDAGGPRSERERTRGSPPRSPSPRACATSPAAARARPSARPWPRCSSASGGTAPRRPGSSRSPTRRCSTRSPSVSCRRPGVADKVSLTSGSRLPKVTAHE